MKSRESAHEGQRGAGRGGHPRRLPLLLRLPHHAPDRARGLHVQAHAQGGRHATCRPRARSRPSTWSTAPSAAGARAMTSSSSPGISLKGEGISYMAGADLPGVIVNVQRGGPGLGGIQPSPGRLLAGHPRARPRRLPRCWCSPPPPCRRWPTCVQQAFDVADQYRTPVMILADGMLGQMMEPVVHARAARAEHAREALGHHRPQGQARPQHRQLPVPRPPTSWSA